MSGERRRRTCEARILTADTAAPHLRPGSTREGLLRDRELFAGRHHDTAAPGTTAPEFHTAGRKPRPGCAGTQHATGANGPGRR
ncbi:hypothetical protein J0910_15270 [Nocardiopsis sp. CNT-189]|uniref:hypothetical protein n=1 Tax=Nocardiopsis oceanisediminis TaxID=2816862 RepID=UPI003B2BCF6F